MLRNIQGASLVISILREGYQTRIAQSRKWRIKDGVVGEKNLCKESVLSTTLKTTRMVACELKQKV